LCLTLSPNIKRGTVHPLYTQSYDQSNAKDNTLTSTGRKGCYSKEGPNQYKSFISLRYRRVLCTPKPFKHCLGYPHGELPVIKHRHQENKIAMVGSQWRCTTTTFATPSLWKGSGQGLGTYPPFWDEVGSRHPLSEEDGPAGTE
jgi:hypothetical protein